MFVNFKRAVIGFTGTVAATLCLIAATAPAISTAAPGEMVTASTLAA